MEQIFYAINEYEKLDMKASINYIPESLILNTIFNEVLLSETNLPMYIPVLDQSNIKVYDMIKEMKHDCGILVGRKVVCAIISDPNGNTPGEQEGKDAKEWGSPRSCLVPVIDYLE